MILAAVDAEGLLELVLVAFVSAVVVAVTFAVCIHGTARAAERSRAGQSRAATAYAAMALTGGGAFAAVVVFGLVVITSK